MCDFAHDSTLKPDKLAEEFDQEQSRIALTDDARELLKNPLIQSLLYDLNLMPEQITKSKHWYYMLAVIAHMGEAMKTTKMTDLAESARKRESASIEIIYVVQGYTGEYSDHHEWAVCGFTKEKLAKELVLKLEALGRNASQILHNGNYRWEQTDEGKALLQADPGASMDYTGIGYTIIPVSMRNDIEGGE